MKRIRYQSLQSIYPDGVVATIGNFDGVHLGHQALIHRVKEEAARLGLPTLLITFHPSPQSYFKKAHAPVKLMGFRHKMNTLASLGLDSVCILNFNQKLALQRAEDFIEDTLLKRLNIRLLIVGSDFRFGRNRLGDLDMLKGAFAKAGRAVVAFDDYCIDATRVSSSKIRQLLAEDKLSEAANYLGAPYTMVGKVIRGNQLGRTFNVPTANVLLKNQTPILNGVYVVQIRREKGEIRYGVANIGKRPTVDGHRFSLEVHVLDANEDYYNEHFTVYFLHKLRDECKFSNLDQLIAQIHQDIEAARQYLKMANAHDTNASKIN